MNYKLLFDPIRAAVIYNCHKPYGTYPATYLHKAAGPLVPPTAHAPCVTPLASASVVWPWLRRRAGRRRRPKSGAWPPWRPWRPWRRRWRQGTPNFCGILLGIRHIHQQEITLDCFTLGVSTSFQNQHVVTPFKHLVGGGRHRAVQRQVRSRWCTMGRGSGCRPQGACTACFSGRMQRWAPQHLGADVFRRVC